MNRTVYVALVGAALGALLEASRRGSLIEGAIVGAALATAADRDASAHYQVRTVAA